MYDEPEPEASSSRESPDRGDGASDADAVPRCSYCGRALDDGESTLLLMRDGRVAAAFHERCHPHHRRSGCSAC